MTFFLSFFFLSSFFDSHSYTTLHKSTPLSTNNTLYNRQRNATIDFLFEHFYKYLMNGSTGDNACAIMSAISMNANNNNTAAATVSRRLWLTIILTETVRNRDSRT